MATRRKKAATTSTTETRKKALALLAEQWGGPSNLAKALGVTPSYISQILANGRPITEKGAEKIESKLSLTPGWMSRAHADEPTKPATIDNTLVIKVIQTVGTLAEEAGMTLAPSRFADVVTLVYEEAVRSKSIDEGYISRILRLVK